MVSVLIPVHNMDNRDFFLKRCLDSVAIQTYKDYEIVQVEEGLVAENINAGIDRCKGDIIKLLCMDDYLAHPDSLQKLVDVFNGGWIATGCNHISTERANAPDGKPVEPSTLFFNHYAQWGDSLLYGRNTIGGLSVIAFPNTNPPKMDTRLKWLIDVDFFHALEEQYGPPTIINDINVTIGIHRGQTTYTMTMDEKDQEHIYMIGKRNLSPIKERYEFCRSSPSDINEHIETLMHLSRDCKHITELGVRKMVSSWAVMEGLRVEGGKLVSIDIVSPEQYGVPLQDIIGGTLTEGVEFEFILGSSLEVEIEETDMLFIDTLHFCDQLSQELKLHAGKTRKYIAMHDTVSNPELMVTINEFLESHPEWKLQTHRTNNNGLTVLRHA